MLHKLTKTGMALGFAVLVMSLNANAQETIESRKADILAAATIIEDATNEIPFAADRMKTHARSQNANQIARWEADITEARGVIETWQDEIQFYAARIEVLNPNLNTQSITTAAATIEGYEDFIANEAANLRNAALAGDLSGAEVAHAAVIGYTQDIQVLINQIRSDVAAL